jgi:Ca2+-binding RTX toxin-like protein
VTITSIDHSGIGEGTSIQLAWSGSGAYGALLLSNGGSNIETIEFADGTTLSSISVSGSIIVLNGTLGHDIINGGNGANNIYGSWGNDVLSGCLGNDLLVGGAGDDTFRFDSALSATTNFDSIWDFSVVDDTIQLENSVFTQIMATGTLLANLFKDLSLGAVDADDRIIYNRTTGVLSYDADGSGAGAAIQFASLNGNPVITAADFLVT